MKTAQQLGKKGEGRKSSHKDTKTQRSQRRKNLSFISFVSSAHSCVRERHYGKAALIAAMVWAAPALCGADTAISETAAAAMETGASLFNAAIARLSGIAAVFGDVTGIRIGGSTVTALAAVGIAKALEDKVPSWVKWLLYAGGGTMLAGGGANIVQAVMNYLPK